MLAFQCAAGKMVGNREQVSARHSDDGLWWPKRADRVVSRRMPI